MVRQKANICSRHTRIIMTRESVTSGSGRTNRKNHTDPRPPQNTNHHQMSVPSPNIGRTALQLYRDCLRLVRHVAPGDCPKGVALRRTVRYEFRRHAHLAVVDDDEDNGTTQQIANLKANAIRALSNYLLAMNASKDPKLKSAMKDFHDRSVPTNNHNNNKP
jgi:Complex 1 protein (LYR family)